MVRTTELPVRKTVEDIGHVLAKVAADMAAAEDHRKFRAYRRRQSPLMGGTIPSSLESLHKLYLEADALAHHYQHQTYRTLGWMFILGLFTAVFFELNAHVVPHDPVSIRVMNKLAPYLGEDMATSVILGATLFIYLSLWGVIGLWYWPSRRDRFQENFRSYRALAEGLRVQFFWLLVGITDSIGEVFEARDADEALPVLDIIEHLAAAPRLEAHRSAGTCELAFIHWVDGQEVYFNNAIKREERRLNLLKRIELWCFWAALLFPLCLMLAHFVFVVSPEDRANVTGAVFIGLSVPAWRLLAIVMSALAMVSAGLLHGYIEKRAFGEHLESYRRIQSMFDYYMNVLKPYRPEDAKDHLREFGKMALRENGDWVSLHRWRPLEPPRG
jgi:hypothetical protein